MKSTDVISIYNDSYFLSSVDGFREFNEFDGSFYALFDRYKRNISILDLRPNHKLLEVGCGRGEVCIYHSMNGGEAKGVDFSADAISLARTKAQSLGAKVDFVQSSFDQLDDPCSSYDRILASEFIEHISIEEGEFFFKKAYDLLKPGGRLMVYTMPNTLQRRYGYPLIRVLAAFRGKKLPKQQDDTLSEHYKSYHLNEQNYFSLRKMTAQAGFINFVVDYDLEIKAQPFKIKFFIKKILKQTPFRHLIFSNLYVLAEK